MDEHACEEQPEYDRVTQASLNGIYVKAQKLDRGHNVGKAPVAHMPGMHNTDCGADDWTHASTHDAAAPTDACGPDKWAHASTHASDASTHASDA